MAIVVNVVLSALVVGGAAWLSGRFPRAAGFLVALPLATMLVLPMAHLQHKDPETTVAWLWLIPAFFLHRYVLRLL
ncbi:MAG: hypothetical protein ACREK6_11145 [Candidatus Rokuibacteriota bacterium]